MCGIFGIAARENTLSFQDLNKLTNSLFLLSESRGKESAGIAISTNTAIRVYKSPIAASKMIRCGSYKTFFKDAIREKGSNEKDLIHSPITLIGHSRLVTNGSEENHDNNQPVIKDGIAAIHNGIVVNDEKLWSKHTKLRRLYQVDTEVILSLIRNFLDQSKSISQAVQSTFSLLEGTASIAFLAGDQEYLVLATNNGSLYATSNSDSSVFVFASEAFILNKFLEKHNAQKNLSGSIVNQVRPGSGLLIDKSNVHVNEFFLTKSVKEQKKAMTKVPSPLPIQDLTPPEVKTSARSSFAVPTIVPESVYKKFLIDEKPIQALRRCTRCVLPETMPFIEFDNEGVCNYCHGYQKQAPLGPDALKEFVEKYRRTDGRPDCLVTLSGGRDSSFSLHYIKSVLNLHPIAYTYDWGMVTDLARRNQARLCGKLGIEHILVSADINQKRSYIRKNVLAWLKHPHLGTVPLFMAGDKQYFYYATKLQKDLGVEFTVLAANPLEETYFKFGFCGLKPAFNQQSVIDQIKLAGFYGREFLRNPAYLNSSLLDSAWAFISYYTIPRNYLLFYKYILWDEKEISNTLINEYDWELAQDTKSTWRIGDGTASFYNYIYYSIAGFSENDTFNSNLVREGVLSRNKALEVTQRDNSPRFDSIKWYCDSIGIDMKSTLEHINQAPKLYMKPLK
jgi:glucosamine--fructose-6-phosphate aminotransferase (isomerizing)